MVRGGPSKRPAADVDASDDDVQESPIKRVKQERHSNANGHDEQEYHARTNGNGHREDSEDAPSSPRADEDMDDDDDESDFERDVSDDEDDIDWDNTEENLAALERVRRDRNSNPDYAVPQCGVIKSVRLINFMNHKNWAYDNFGAKINFIVGHNGSGKSAVLTAIAIALGARASVTGRGSGVKDLIRRGAEKATIIVTLVNRGPLAYMPDKYPEYIVIERSFDKKGTTTYKFRATRDGPVLETKRQELDNITSHFSINMDSPLTLLTQDMAKTFLASADEAKLYDFFLGGSSLKQLSTQYEEIKELVAKMTRDLEDSQKALPAVQQRADKYQRLVQAAERQATMKEELAHVRQKLGWCFVIEREEQIEDHKRNLEAEERKLAKLEQSVAELEAQNEELETNIKRMSEELEESNRQAYPIRSQIRDLKRERDNKFRDLRSTKGILEDVMGEIEQKKHEVETLEAKIAARASQNGPVESPQEKKLRDDLRKYNQMRSNMNRQEPESRRAIPAIEQKLEQARNDLRMAETRRDELATKREGARRQESNLAQRRSDPMAAFGDRIDLVLTAIRRAKWREPPLGPLGQYVQLKDENYRGIIHTLLGGILCGFAVRYPEDKDQLLRILKSCVAQGFMPGTGGKQIPQIFMHKGDRFDFSEGDLSNRGRTILSILNITNDTVLRILVDLVKIERVFLAPDQHQGLDMVNKLLKNGLQTVTVFSEDIWRNSGGPAEFRTSGPAGRWHGNNLFVRDTTTALNSLREQLNILNKEYAAVMDECKQRTAHVREVEAELRDATNRVRKIEMGVTEATRKINEIQDQLEALQPDDGDTLQQAKDDAEQALEQMEIERAKVEADIKAVEADIRRIEGEYQALEEQENKLGPALAQKKDAIHQLATDRVKCRSDLEYRRKGKTTSEQKVEAARRQVQDLQDELVEWAAQAASLGPRLDFSEGKAELNRRLDALNKSIQEAERRNEIDADEALRKFNLACQELKTIKESCRNNAALVKYIEKGLQRRMDVWLQLRTHAASRVTSVFTYNLNTRGFEGTMTFDHAIARLRLRVTTTAPRASGGVEDYAKSANRLSGGERSYSTVCFLLALWETCATTMACLDEWDVFLDSVNRQLAGQLIMEGAKTMVGKQFILITPLDMGGLQVGGPHNKVIRMGDPERGQGSLV